MCPIWKEVLDQPVQTKCWTPHIFCASCWSLSFKMCRSLCPVCWTVTVYPNKFIEPAPFVLRTILSELDFQCPTCKHTVQLHQLPQHQEYCIQSPTTAPTRLNPFPKISFSKTIPPCPSETHTCSRGKGTSAGKCTINTSRTYNYHQQNNNLWGTTVSYSTTNQPKGSLFILKGGSWIVYHSTVRFTVSGWGNYPPQNRWLGNKIFFKVEAKDINFKTKDKIIHVQSLE